jgi:hypothetical protein
VHFPHSPDEPLQERGRRHVTSVFGEIEMERAQVFGDFGWREEESRFAVVGRHIGVACDGRSEAATYVAKDCRTRFLEPRGRPCSESRQGGYFCR